MKVNLRIEELVLDGFNPADRYRIGDSVERELARLIAKEGIPATLTQAGIADRIDAGKLEMVPGTKAENVGRKVAKAVYGGFR